MSGQGCTPIEFFLAAILLLDPSNKGMFAFLLQIWEDHLLEVCQPLLFRAAQVCCPEQVMDLVCPRVFHLVRFSLAMRQSIFFGNGLGSVRPTAPNLLHVVSQCFLQSLAPTSSPSTASLVHTHTHTLTHPSLVTTTSIEL